VIAARSRRPIPASGFSARAAATAATGQPEQRGDVELAYGYRTGGILATARAREFDDYSSPDGVVPFSGWRDAGARVMWTQSLNANQFTIGWQRDDARDIGRPRSDSNAIVASGPFERSNRVTVALERATLRGWRDVRADGFFGTSELRNEQDRLPAPGRPRRIDRADGSARDLQARVTGRRALGPLDVHAGVDLQRRFDVAATDTAILFNASGTATGTAVTNTMASANRTALGAFGEGEIRLTPWMRASGGVRVDGTRSENRGGFFGDRTTRRTAVAGAGAVTVAPGRSTAVTFQIARGFREPTLTDRFSRGPVGRGFLEGNPDLVPETSRQYDVTIRHIAGPIQITGAAYRYDIRDLIERYTAGVDLFRTRNRGRARLSGVELEARVDVGRGFTVDLTGQVSRGRDAGDGTPLDDVAPRSAGLVARHLWRDRVSSYLRFTAVADHDRAGPSEVPTPGYRLLDAGAGWRINQALEVRASFRNLLNTSFYASSGPRWVWAPGRQAAVTVVIAARR
jgi:outer membrane receptor protein involved in Fe transport